MIKMTEQSSQGSVATVATVAKTVVGGPCENALRKRMSSNRSVIQAVRLQLVIFAG
jgi:hypothetical protein